MKGLVFALLLAHLLVIPISCLADDYGPESLQCPSGLINVGDSKVSVIASCGQPVDRNTLDTGDESLTFNLGPTDFVYNMKFNGGQLVRIQPAGRGY